MEGRSEASLTEGLPDLRVGPPEKVDIDDLAFDDYVRYSGEDPSHSRALAAIGEEFPPIYVHAESMSVLDGFHRVCAAKRRNESQITARLIHGPRADAFVLAVRANSSFGKPLTLAERERSARRILLSHPQWSDRLIAEACGLSGKTVANLRPRATEEMAQLNMRRIGRDGKSRPVNVSDNRRRAAQLIEENPEASLREIGRQSQLSPATVRDVRDRVIRGEAPTKEMRSDDAHGGSEAWPVYHEVVVDVALQSAADGDAFTAWFTAHLIGDQDWPPMVSGIPLSRVYVVADQARSCAAAWRHFADALEARVNKRRLA
jgi:hypothetical protein